MFPRPKEIKHIACSRCRERKVKCDGGKPGCRRCQRLGHECQYVQGRKHQGKSEWVQHLRMFNSQPGKAGSISSPQSQSQTSTQSTSPSQPNPTEISNTDPATQDIRSSSPHPTYSISSSPSSPSNINSISIDVETSFNSFDNVDNWLLPASPSVAPSLGMDGESLDSQLYTFNSAETWCRTNYTSELITTGPGDSLMSGQGFNGSGFNENGVGEIFDPSSYCNPPPYFTSTTNVADWKLHHMASYPVSQGASTYWSYNNKER
ncbi:hypothetical protein K505DRAFT_416831 [Melanomma pulvis-pyrius CBS 109.77]|uniref:Zn(2)-C6 fungal-type domain-containing protein n=1 Tax=Melanomma pulvis-pyrius CBS 109.77 TaxID=1314802 RepID=A0A6A6XFK2_9PLEO|nr:hypothetical protein K505DRAFT_416831 [Melanomma pulvis-pyrius CBS 109.77]